MRVELILRYVVIKNDGVNVYEAEAGFDRKAAAIEYADMRARDFEAYDPEDSVNVYNSAMVAHYEVVDAVNSDDAFETVYETKSFYNE